MIGIRSPPTLAFHIFPPISHHLLESQLIPSLSVQTVDALSMEIIKFDAATRSNICDFYSSAKY